MAVLTIEKENHSHNTYNILQWFVSNFDSYLLLNDIPPDSFYEVCNYLYFRYNGIYPYNHLDW